MERPIALARRHWPLAALLTLAGVLRVPWLGAIPTPAGDEGNWTLYGLRILRSQPVALAPAARFVTLAFARLIAVSYGILGPGFTAARAVLVTGVLLGIVVTWVAGRRLAGPVTAAVAATVLAVHPWSVLWSRTASVPYALDLALGVAGPLCLLSALRARSFLGLVLAAQVLAVGVQFSPLAVIPMVAAVLWVLRPAVRTTVSPVQLLVAGLLGGLHLVPVVSGALVARAAGGAPRGPAFDQMGLRLGCFVRMVLGALSGEATAAHFAGRSMVAEVLGAAVVLGVLGVCTVVLAEGRRDGSVGAFAARHFGLALVGLPILLLPGRDWHMPTIDAERYGFALLAPFALWVGAAAGRGGTGRASRQGLPMDLTPRPPLPGGRGGASHWNPMLSTPSTARERGVGGVRSGEQRRDAAGRLAAVVYLSWLLVVPTGRSVVHFIAGGGSDQGLYVLHGGGRYRGWQVPRGRVSLPEVIRGEVLRRARGEPATVAYDDYAFHAVRFVNAVADDGRVDHSLGGRVFPHGRLVYFVVWADEAFAPGYAPAGVPEANRGLRTWVRAMDPGAREVRAMTQPDGTPLCELWETRAP